MTSILAIDPGSTESAYIVIRCDDYAPLEYGKVPNPGLLRWLDGYIAVAEPDRAVIEMVASYGMAVGKEVFETCVWIGRFIEAIEPQAASMSDALVYRRDIKLHHCGSARAKDSNVRQALVDRFAPGQPNHGKGTKAEPGWFHGFHSDIWQAYALAVYAADTLDSKDAA